MEQIIFEVSVPQSPKENAMLTFTRFGSLFIRIVAVRCRLRSMDNEVDACVELHRALQRAFSQTK
eukprot:3177310-Amphidinium_carterae.1